MRSQTQTPNCVAIPASLSELRYKRAHAHGVGLMGLALYFCHRCVHTLYCKDTALAEYSRDRDTGQTSLHFGLCLQRMPKVSSVLSLSPRSRPGTPATHVSAPLQAGKVRVRNEEDRLSVKINKGFENRDIHPFVRGEQRHFDIRNWKKQNRTPETPRSAAYIHGLDLGHRALCSDLRSLNCSAV